MALSDDIWWTRKARIQSEKRLLNNAFQSQLLLLWYSFSGVAVSVYYLKISTDNSLAGVTWIVFSVLILCMSGFISGLSFKERASLIKECYETLKTVEKNSREEGSNETLIARDYERILGLCENHTDHDYYKSLCIEYLNSTEDIDLLTGLKKNMTRRPTRYHWFRLIIWEFKRFLMFSLLYAVPVLLFIGVSIV